MLSRRQMRDLLHSSSWEITADKTSYGKDASKPRTVCLPPTSMVTNCTFEFYPPPASVEDEDAALAREHGGALQHPRDEEPTNRGDPDQHPIIQLAPEYNTERRFVLIGTEQGDLEQKMPAESEPNQYHPLDMSGYKANTRRKVVVVADDRPTWKSNMDLPRIITNVDPERIIHSAAADSRRNSYFRSRRDSSTHQGSAATPDESYFANSARPLSGSQSRRSMGKEVKPRYERSRTFDLKIPEHNLASTPNSSRPQQKKRAYSSVTPTRHFAYGSTPYDLLYQDESAIKCDSSSSSGRNTPLEDEVSTVSDPVDARAISSRGVRPALQTCTDLPRPRVTFADLAQVCKQSEKPWGEGRSSSRPPRGSTRRSTSSRRDASSPPLPRGPRAIPVALSLKSSLKPPPRSDIATSPQSPHFLGPVLGLPNVRHDSDRVSLAPHPPPLSSRDSYFGHEYYGSDNTLIGFAPAECTMPRHWRDRESAPRSPRLRASRLIDTVDDVNTSNRQLQLATPSRGGRQSDQIRSYRDFLDSVTTGRAYPLPPCPRRHATATYDDWRTIPRTPGFNICPSCYDQVFAADTSLAYQFVPAPQRTITSRIACSFGSSPWIWVAWLMTRKYSHPDLHVRLVQNVANILARQQPCPGSSREYRTWCSVPGSGTVFTACQGCAKAVETIFPSLTGVFVPSRSATLPPIAAGGCSLRFSPEASSDFTAYFDAFELTHDHAVAARSAPDVLRLGYRLRNVAGTDVWEGRRRGSRYD